MDLHGLWKPARTRRSAQAAVVVNYFFFLPDFFLAEAGADFLDDFLAPAFLLVFLEADFPRPKMESQLSAYCSLEPTRTIVTAGIPSSASWEVGAVFRRAHCPASRRFPLDIESRRAGQGV
jgi:hypothetical protein